MFGPQPVPTGTSTYCLGNLSEATTGSGGLSGRQRYFPYGLVRYTWGSLPTTYNFTGQRLDGTGLLYYGARYYDPLIGRFTQPDTIVPQPGNPQSLNRYTYALGNPLKFTDPTGHCAEAGLTPIPCTPIVQQLGQWVAQAWQWISALTVQAAPAVGQITQYAQAYGPQLTTIASEAAKNAENAQRALQSGEPANPGGWDPGKYQEEQIRQQLANRGYQQVHGMNDSEIARNLGIRGKVADFLGYNSQQGRWLIAESKGSDIDTAIKQLENTMQGLLAKNPAVRTGDIDLHIYLNERQFIRFFQAKEGWGILEGKLGYFDYTAQQWTFYEINGVPIYVYVAPP